MKQAVSLVFKTRSTLIATHLCVCSLSVGVTLAILNVHPLVGFMCFGIVIICVASIIKSINKQYWSGKHFILHFSRRDGKLHIERSKTMMMEQKDNTQGQDQLKW
jgi:hypothetical protein